MARAPFAWEKSYPAGVRWDTPIAGGTLPALFDQATDTYVGRTAIEYRDRPITFASLRQGVDQAAAAFLKAGVGAGTTVALYLPNCPYHPLAFFGALKAGARLLHLSPLDAERELAHKLADGGARTLVTTNLGNMLPNALKLLDGGHVDRVIVGDDAAWGASHMPLTSIARRPGLITWDDFAAAAVLPAMWPAVSPSDVALLQYTGGTTGLPKGAMLTHANLTSAQSIYDAWNPVAPDRPIEKVIGVLPLFHVYALTVVLIRNIYVGNEILLRPRFDVETTLRDIEEKRATMFPGVPTMWIALANHPGIETRDLSSLKRCTSGGAPMPVDVRERFENLTGLALRGGWGMTETCSPGCALPADAARAVPPGAAGLPLPRIEMDVVALDDATRPLPPGETGEIRVRGPNVTAGYWNRPEETKAAFVADYFLTGDIGYMNADGYFFFVDRKKDMIISGGFNVYPQMLEQAIYEHPSVEEVLVVGVPDAYRGEAAKAFVKLRTGATEFTLEELHAFLADKVGRHEMPAALEFRARLPRTAVGKFSKVELRDEERRKHQEKIRRSA